MSRPRTRKHSTPPLSPRKRLKAKLRVLRTKLFGPSRRRHVRRFVNPELGRLGLFAKLHERNIRYVVLRWFHDLPDWPAGEDIDILIDNRDLNRIDDLFVHNHQSIPCDVYSSTAAKGADMKGLAYYPKNLADQLLDCRVMHQNYCYVPEPEHYFLSLAFHAVYHKAETSGLAWDDSTPIEYELDDDEHEYADVLRQAIPQSFHDVPMTMTGLHQFLAEKGWAPAVDTLRKYAIRRPALHDLVPPQQPNQDGELLLFVYRSWGLLSSLV